MARSRKVVLATALPIIAVAIFLLESYLAFNTIDGTVLLLGVYLLFGVAIVWLAKATFELALDAKEGLIIGVAVGFGFNAWLGHFLRASHLSSIGMINLFELLIAMAILGKARYGTRNIVLELSSIAICTLAFLAIYNLQNFHLAANHSIVTRGLFGVDIPFLAGEVNGIQDFGALRDLHQSAQPWHYHDATYYFIALLPSKFALGALSYTVPLLGYIVLAFAVYVIILRFASSRYIVWISVASWFLVNGLATGEMGSYALSPSFVFGSLIFLTILLVFDIRLKEVRRKQQIVLSIIFLYLLIELSQTKLSQFLVLDIGLGVVALWSLRKQRTQALELILLAALPLALVLYQSSGPNPLMPGEDFLIGAPLLGYANHLASALHTSVAAVNPVSYGLYLKPQSFLIIPFFLFHFLRLVVMEPKILAAIIVLVALRTFYVKSELIATPLARLLTILIPLGFFLPVLYSPAWYPLALSFYAPLVSVQAAMLVVAMAWPQLANSEKRSQKAALGIAAIVLLFGFAFGARTILNEDSSKPRVVGASLIGVMSYLTNQSDPTDIILSRRYDLDSADESFYWYSALSGRTVVSEGAKYGSLLGAVADTDSEKGLHPVLAAQKLLASRRALIDTVFLSTDSLHVRWALSQTKAAYILEDTAKGRFLASNPQFYADKVHSEGEYTLWRVR